MNTKLLSTHPAFWEFFLRFFLFSLVFKGGAKLLNPTLCVKAPHRTGRSLDPQVYINALSGFKEGLLQNPREMIFSGKDSGFGPKVRVTGQKSALQNKSQSYSRGDPQNPNRISQKRNPNGV